MVEKNSYTYDKNVFHIFFFYQNNISRGLFKSFIFFICLCTVLFSWTLVLPRDNFHNNTLRRCYPFLHLFVHHSFIIVTIATARTKHTYRTHMCIPKVRSKCVRAGWVIAAPFPVQTRWTGTTLRTRVRLSIHTHNRYTFDWKLLTKTFHPTLR